MFAFDFLDHIVQSFPIAISLIQGSFIACRDGSAGSINEADQIAPNKSGNRSSRLGSNARFTVGFFMVTASQFLCKRLYLDRRFLVSRLIYKLVTLTYRLERIIFWSKNENHKSHADAWAREHMRQLGVRQA